MEIIGILILGKMLVVMFFSVNGVVSMMSKVIMMKVYGWCKVSVIMFMNCDFCEMGRLD